MYATKITAGVYDYRGQRIERYETDDPGYSGWWSIFDLSDPLMEREHYPTKRAAMRAIDNDPPEGW